LQIQKLIHSIIHEGHFMPINQPISREQAVTDIVMGLILSLITCGIYALVWQFKQFKTINAWLGREEHNFWMYVGLSIITCGIYAVYYQYKFDQTINEVQRQNNLQFSDNLPIVALLLTLFGLSLVTMAIEQAEINRWYQLPENV
jgi:uncharacterized membrane protein YidH (DUF202 family)